MAENFELLHTSLLAARSEKALAGGVAPLLRRAAAVYHRPVRGQSGPSGLEPRRRGAGRRAALCLSTRPRTRSSGTSATRPTPTRSSPGRCEAFRTKRLPGRHQRLSAHGRERVRRLRGRARLGVDFRGVRHGQGRRAAGRAAPGRGRDRRRFDDRRPRVRRAQQRRGQQAHRPPGDPQRQPHGHRPGDGRAEELPAEDLDLGALQPVQAAAVGPAVAYAASAAPVPAGGQRRQAGGAQQEQSVREPQFPLLRTGGRPQPRGVGADAARDCTTSRDPSCCTS